MQILEIDIESKVVGWAQKHGFLTPKVKFAERGWPDRLFISPKGHTIFIEFKRPTIIEPEKLQEYRIKELKKRGIPAFQVNNILEGITILQAALEPTPVPGESDKTTVVASVSRIVSGSRARQDQHSARGVKNPESERLIGPLPDRGPTPGDERSVAPRDRKVARFPGDDVDNPPWGEENSPDTIP